jgi:tetratricopeptide (TPR) repeat protein
LFFALFDFVFLLILLTMQLAWFRTSVLLIFCCWLLTNQWLLAQNFSVSPQQTTTGLQETFTLSYTLSGAELRDFQAPDFSNFRIVGGPNKSQSITMTNGSVARSIGISYILLPQKIGTFTIPPATVVTDNKKSLRSGKVTVKVVQGKTQTQPPASPFGNLPFGFPAPPMPPQQQPTPAPRANDEPPRLFLKIKLDTNSVFVGQQLGVTYQLYTNTPVSTFELEKAPQFTGFWVEELPTTGAPQNGTYKGANFKIVDVKRYALFPQQAGKLNIDAITGIAQAEIIDPSANTWFGQAIIQKVSVKSDSATIQIQALPTNAPAEFTGGVGNFILKASTDKTTLAQNESFKLLVEMNGTGNVKFIGEPIIVFPPSFEHFDPLNTETITPIGNHIGGTKTFEYTIVPTEQGRYEIPPIQIAYFDPSSRQYRRLEQTAIPITVTASNGAIANLDEGNIYPLRTAPLLSIGSKIGALLQYPIYWILLLLPILLYIGRYIRQRFRPQNAENTTELLHQTAYSSAIHHIEQAYRTAAKHPSTTFYEQLLDNLQQYFRRKNILPDEAILSENKLSQALTYAQIPDTLVQQCLSLIAQSTTYLYAPLAINVDNIRTDYAQAQAVLRQIEDHLNGSSSQTNAFKLAIWLGVLGIFSTPVFANDNWETAEQQYQQKNYRQAAQIYEQLLQNGEKSAALYHNLGNCYYQLQQTAPAILNYERALRLSPRSTDIQHNLQQANKRVSQKVDTLPLLFYQKGLQTLASFLSVNVWAILALVAVWVWFVAQKKQLHRIFYYRKQRFTLFYSWLWAAVALLCLLFAYQSYRYSHAPEAIIFAPILQLQAQPSPEANTLLELSAGAKVRIIDDAADWWKVQAMNGEIAWVEQKYLHKVIDTNVNEAP